MRMIVIRYFWKKELPDWRRISDVFVIEYRNMKEEIRDWFRDLQRDICLQLEEADTAGKFIHDVWDRPGGGGRASLLTVAG